MEQAAYLVELIATSTKLAFEIASILIVAIGGAAMFYQLVSSGSFSQWLNTMRQAFARYLLVALELQLAADIIGTAIAPSWEQLGKLAAIAVIRTFLNYFLVEETQARASLAIQRNDPDQKAKS